MATNPNNYVTKKYLDERLKYSFNEFRKEMDERFNEFREEIREELKEFKNAIIQEMLNIKDAIITELRIVRDNQKMHDASHTRINTTLRDHDKRIESLEVPSGKS